ncbi:MAG: hypothetical protein MMC33_007999 [Icmadophila ericetorum]|nr:hypothetical protein [Icmadophila ericetorum]
MFPGLCSGFGLLRSNGLDKMMGDVLDDPGNLQQTTKLRFSNDLPDSNKNFLDVNGIPLDRNGSTNSENSRRPTCSESGGFI